jgi:hypothetical protein
MALNNCQTLLVKFFSGHHPNFVCTGEVEIVFAVNLAAKANLQNASIQQETFFEGPAERRAVRILAAEILVP